MGSIERLPYIIVIGEKEQNSESISLRSRKNGDEGNCSLEAFISRITQEIDGKMLDN
ncbi:His/Gly/Thr/Pro-type tRNA ligase C-terminal domain-containing protein [Clostridium sp. CM027]|uniref:His/Gly/Thr/Pro-type tRNA ligase C-terminal domain-containing protein n=1 Tax=unclassified Clostridium TaxID=2614128 RepID=UPI0035C7DC0F